MKLARYVGQGRVEISDEPEPICPSGGLLIETRASGLCSGELMSWYMEQKIPHVLGHEVSGTVVESQDDRFPVGSHVFPHHHAPCMNCNYCITGRFVHCNQWKRSKLIPGGMAERFGVPKENLTDTLLTNDLRPQDAALIEPLACVAKSMRLAGKKDRTAVIGLGVMGLLHMLVLHDENPIGFDINPNRVEWARSLGLDAKSAVSDHEEEFDLVYVCPGSQSAFDVAVAIAAPEGRILMFAPLGPGEQLKIENGFYFKDLQLINSYSCGPQDTLQAKIWLEQSLVRAEDVVSHFISIDELPNAYQLMKSGTILKPMVMFP